MFVAEVHPNQNECGCVVLIVDGSKPHITRSNITECKELGVEIVVLPAFFSDAIQPLDRTVCRALKRAFGRLERERQRGRKGKAASPASFVELWTKCFVEAVTPRKHTKWFQILWHQPISSSVFFAAPAPCPVESPPHPVECLASHVSPAHSHSSASPASPASGCRRPIMILGCSAERKRSIWPPRIIHGTCAWWVCDFQDLQ